MKFTALLIGLRTDEHSFVKWWRKENDFLDYDLIDRFITNIDHAVEIDGMELLTLDEMWEAVERIGGSRVKLVRDSKGEHVEWTHVGKNGTHHEVCI